MGTTHRLSYLMQKVSSKDKQKLYGSGRWKARRLRQLKAHPLCCYCAKQGRVTAARIADHIERHDYDAEKFFHGGLQSLCDDCHQRAKQSEELKGFSTQVGIDGWPVDPRHPANKKK